MLLFLFFFLCLPAESFCFQINKLYSSVQSPTLNIVFTGLQYPQQGLFIKDTECIQAKLFSLKPFAELKEQIQIHYLVLDNNEEGVFFKQRQGTPPVVVRKDLLKKIAEQVGQAFKLVILDYQGSNTCAELSSIDRMSVIVVGRRRYVTDKDFVKGFLHELGHSLGLRDECIHCAKVEMGYPNCAPDIGTAKKWWGEFVGKKSTVDYVGGCCGQYECVRPTIASLMNDTDKASSYGFVNEEYIRREFQRIINSGLPAPDPGPISFESTKEMGKRKSTPAKSPFASLLAPHWDIRPF